MSKKARDKKVFSRGIKAGINKDFNSTAVRFITDIFEIEGKAIPNFEDNDEICKVYGETHSRILSDLIWHRNKPIAPDKLNKLQELNSLPKSIRIILDSFTYEQF